MSVLRRVTAAFGSAVLITVPLSIVGAPAASAAEREFRCSGASVDFEVEREGGRFEVDVSIDGTRNSRWRVTLRQDGRVVSNRVHRADNDGDVDVRLRRPNTPGADVFKLRVKKIGGAPACTSRIRLR
ncbi:hypothetical protein [Nocardioides sp. zg-DK7169]|uniref:hypothetical protein n=1 Tax=Nocardioides sp. zg-DK7169 TaxID=2736600 RepID=UPI0015525EB3|nr:hypothetical protein [Nocardioides sp. zg-DK7169]NPC97556.1 hypothetical protein [Nocardioides sp. zg-DK7169]